MNELDLASEQFDGLLVEPFFDFDNETTRAMTKRAFELLKSGKSDEEMQRIIKEEFEGAQG